MAALTMTFLHGLHLQTLSRVVGNLRCCTTSHAIKYCGLHRSISKSASKDNIDIDSSEAVCGDVTQTVDEKIARNIQKNKYSEHSPANSRRKINPTPSRYLKNVWLNYSSTITEDALDTSAHNNLQTESLKKASDRLAHQNETENTFGALSMKIKGISEKPDVRNPNERIDEKFPEDIDAKRDRRLDIPLTRFGRIGKTSFYYSKKMAILGWQGKIKEAIAMFEDWMMVRDRVMPTKRTFVILIGILGRVGYTKKAFELFRQMKQLGLDPEDRIYTSLFNACANSPSPVDTLKQTEYLLNHMKERRILPNLITVKAAMKALAVCGDFSRAFTLLDATSARLRLDGECFNHLLMACVGDKEAGFRRALQVWQKMALYRVQPDVYSFNLLTRITRDCGIGDLDTTTSCFNLDSFDVGSSERLGLLESIHLDTSLGEEENLSSRSVRQTDRSRQSVGKLEVIGKKVKIHTDSEQQDSSVDRANHDTKEQKVSHTFTGTAINKQENKCDNRGLHNGDRVDRVGDEWNELPKHASITDLPDSLPYLGHDAEITSKECKERSSSLSNSAVTAFPTDADHSKSGAIHQSLYSDLLTNNTGSSNSILENRQSNKISLKDLKFPSGRLALLGGASKLISVMEALQVHPDVKTFTQILACLPNDEWSEFHLLTVMEKKGVKPDIDFFNDIMIRRFHRKENESVKAVLKLVSKLRLTPNMRTFAAISLTCRKGKDAQQFLQDMKEANLEPNCVIMGHLIYASGSNYNSKLNLLKTMESLGLKPTQNNIATIERSIALTKRKIIEAEKSKNTASFHLSEQFQKSFQQFLRYYKSWLQRTEMDKPRHPWESFKPQEKKEEESLNIVG